MRVLVVDDDPDVRSVLERALERDGHVVACATDLSSARAALAAHETDVIVLDLGLPDGSGVELCRTLRAERETIPVLVVTARSEVTRRVEALDAGADDFLAKPFAVAELRARVRALGRRRALPLVACRWAGGAATCEVSTLGRSPWVSMLATAMLETLPSTPPIRPVGAHARSPAVAGPTQPGPRIVRWA